MPSTRKANGLNCDHGRRRQAIVESLMADVFRGRVRAGEHLVTREIAERFGVSHTPVREALITLAGIGFVELLPNRGAVVRRVAPSEVREICQVRRVLECEAARSACGRIDSATLLSLATEFKQLRDVVAASDDRYIKAALILDNRLHDLIANSCGNVLLANELSRLKVLFRGFRDFAWERYGARRAVKRLDSEAREHLAIVEALLAGDRKEAARAMARHIHSGMKYWTRVVPSDNGESPETDWHPRVKTRSPR